jgi:hypothetical protein
MLELMLRETLFMSSGSYYRGARRELGLMRHTCLAFVLVGDDGLGHVEQGGTPTRQGDRESFHRF